jgi:hypothetical protein
MVSMRSKKIYSKKRRFRKTNKRGRLHKKIKGGECNGSFSKNNFIAAAKEGGLIKIKEYLNSIKDCKDFREKLKSEFIFRTEDLNIQNTQDILNMLNAEYLTKYAEDDHTNAVRDRVVSNFTIYLNQIITWFNNAKTPITEDIKNIINEYDGTPSIEIFPNCEKLLDIVKNKRKENYIDFLKIRKRLIELFEYKIQIHNTFMHKAAKFVTAGYNDKLHYIKDTINKFLSLSKQLNPKKDKSYFRIVTSNRCN